MRQVVKDDKWLDGPFLSKVQKRGAEIISVMKKSSAASAANAACDHVHDWWHGSPEGSYVSMGVINEAKAYGISEGINYSFPCVIKTGEWKNAEGISHGAFS